MNKATSVQNGGSVACKHLILTCETLTSLFIPVQAFALRCGSELASIGDRKHEVRLACGEPLYQEVIGYIDQERTGERIRVMKIEEWIIEEAGYYYSLEFEGNILTCIEAAGTRK